MAGWAVFRNGDVAGDERVDAIVELELSDAPARFSVCADDLNGGRRRPGRHFTEGVEDGPLDAAAWLFH